MSKKLTGFVLLLCAIKSVGAQIKLSPDEKSIFYRGTFFDLLTEGIADRLGFFRAKRSLRNKANAHLEKLYQERKNFVNELWSRDRGHDAQYMTLATLARYENLVAKFNRVFERADYVFLMTAEEFDAKHQSVQEKEEFINQLLSKLTRQVNGIIADNPTLIYEKNF